MRWVRIRTDRVGLGSLTTLNLASNGRMTVKDEMERIWKEVVVEYYKLLSQYLPGVTTEHIRIVDLRTEIRNRNLQNTQQGCS
jgi:hypothetical protein